MSLSRRMLSFLVFPQKEKANQALQMTASAVIAQRRPSSTRPPQGRGDCRSRCARRDVGGARQPCRHPQNHPLHGGGGGAPGFLAQTVGLLAVIRPEFVMDIAARTMLVAEKTSLVTLLSAKVLTFQLAASILVSPLLTIGAMLLAIIRLTSREWFISSLPFSICRRTSSSKIATSIAAILVESANSVVCRKPAAVARQSNSTLLSADRPSGSWGTCTSAYPPTSV